MPRTFGIRVGLLRDVLLITLLLGGTVLGVGWQATRQAITSFAGDLLAQVLDGAEIRLRHFFEPPAAALGSIAAWDAAGLLDADGGARRDEILAPLLNPLPQIRALVLRDADGGSYRLQRGPSGWTGGGIPPGARAGAGSGAPPPPGDFRHGLAWSAPHRGDDGEPMITASLAVGSRRAPARVISLDLDLAALPPLSTGPGVSAAVGVALLDGDGRLLQVPALGPLADPDLGRGALLRSPEAVGWPPLAEARRAVEPASGDVARLNAGGEAYWTARRHLALEAGPPLTIVALVPEGHLVSALVNVQDWLVIAVAGVLVLVVVRVMALARRLSRPIEALVAETDRIGRGDLDAGPKVESGVTEIQRLAEAHGRMRAGLRSLTRMEDALQVARRIQQNTLPERIPFVTGFDIDAFSEPAEETGGDTYDVVGYRIDSAGRTVALSVDHADRALMLLADATGHGAGPALSATQVRAMLRMAVRTGASLEQIVRHINEQLCDDLHGGRFITAWLGIADAVAGTITNFSAGQAPLFHYHAGERRTERIEADTPPFGISRDLAIPELRPRVLAPGDVFAVLSDGILEAGDAQGEQFGEARAVEVIEHHHAETAGLVVTRLRQALARFTTGARPGDDRTAVIVRREPSG